MLFQHYMNNWTMYKEKIDRQIERQIDRQIDRDRKTGVCNNRLKDSKIPFFLQFRFETYERLVHALDCESYLAICEEETHALHANLKKTTLAGTHVLNRKFAAELDAHVRPTTAGRCLFHRVFYAVVQILTLKKNIHLISQFIISSGFLFLFLIYFLHI